MYTKDDFRRCSMNALEENLFERYPRLLEMLPVDRSEKIFSQDDTQQAMMIRYVLALYDPKSPIIKDYPDLNTRKTAAAEIAGYNLEKDTDVLQVIYTCNSEYLVEFIVTYLRQIVQSRSWASITADEQTYWEFIQRMMLSINRTNKDKDDVSAVALKTKLGEDKENIAERLERNWNRFLGDDEELKKKIQKAKGWSPEEMAGVK
jgi:hypothetical protein